MTHPHMTAIDRAAQFSPFAALIGHDVAIKETPRLTNERIDLDGYWKVALNDRLHFVRSELKSIPKSQSPTFSRMQRRLAVPMLLPSAL